MGCLFSVWFRQQKYVFLPRESAKGSEMSEAIGQRNADVAEATVYDVEVIAEIEGHHGAIVHAEGEGDVFQGETEAQGADRAEEKAVVFLMVVVAYTRTEASPEFPRGKARCPVGPLPDVPVVNALKGETLVEVEQAGGKVEEVLLVEMVLVFQVGSGAAKVYADGVWGALRLRCEGGQAYNKGEQEFSHVCIGL